MSLGDFIRKKGNYPILSVLKYKGNNYNSIKEKVTPKISARTLDHRLNQLTDLGILTAERYDEKGPVRKFYNLTETGRIILATFESIRDLLKESMGLSSFLDNISAKMGKYKILEFDHIWRELSGKLGKGDTIFTLSQQSPNKIVEIDDSGITVKTQKGIDKISIEKIRHAWTHLAKDGILYRNDHEKATYRSSFMLALFTKLSIVKERNKPPLSVEISLPKS
ncbi:MAG: winged helix-turn-helix transcriptional regulator [Promethearchaeia archaeon]